MHVALLVFVGRGGCENPAEKWAGVVVVVALGNAPPRATDYSICQALSLGCALACPLHTHERNLDVDSPSSSQLGSRGVVVPGFVAEGVKANKSYNPAHTQKVRHVAPSHDTSMGAPYQEESNAGLFENSRFVKATNTSNYHKGVDYHNPPPG